MKILLLRIQILLTIFLLTSNYGFAQRKFEKLGRGVVAVNLGSGKVYVSWRLLVSDPENVSFNVYRSIGGAEAVKINSSPVTATTDFTDNSASTTATNSYLVKPVINGTEQAASKPFTIPGSVAAKRYFSIPLQPLAHYSVQHIYPGDLDGDGEYDYVVKRLPADPHNNVILEAYKNDGTFMWRIDLGPNMEQGASTHNPFVLVYDFDSDGKAEVLTRSGEGTVFADGYKIPDMNGDGITDYRTFPPVTDLGYMLRGDNCPEYVSMVEGTTGKEITRTDFIDRGPKNQWMNLWGDTDAHRMSMIFAGVAYLDGIHPSIVSSRGPGEKMDVIAWDYKNKQITTRWKWSSRNNTNIPAGYHWADFHNIRILDLDGDGKDEISYGVNAMDDNGTPLYYAKNDIGHGDRFVITDLDPDRPGLECYAIQQSTSVLAVLYDVKNGERIKTWSSAAPFDVGRGDAADIDPRVKGAELWSYAHRVVQDCKGNPVAGADTFPHPALSIWWDGDLLRENLDAADGNGFNPVINKWNYTANKTDRLLSLYNEGGNYSTKTPYAGRAALYGDILGDWREEVFCMNSDSTEIRIFSTWTPATNRLYCLMQNPEYRACIGPKGYLPSTEVDYYLGVGMTTPPTPPVLSVKNIWAGGLNGNVWDIATTDNWKSNDIAGKYSEVDTIMFDISGTGYTGIALNSTVNPGYMIINSPVGYSFYGSGKISGSTSLLKSGSGFLAIATDADYTGTTKVEQGIVYFHSNLSQSTVKVFKDAAIGGTGTIAKPVTFEKGSIIIPGAKDYVGSLTFSSAVVLPGKNRMVFDITDDPAGTSKPSDKIIVNGDLTITDTIYIDVNKINGTVNPGSYPIISYSGTFAGNLNRFMVTGLFGQKVTFSNTSGVIYMNVLASRPPQKVTWSGTGADWDLMTSANWLANEAAEVFVSGDTTIFNSTGSGQYNVNIKEPVSVGDMIVDASSNDYSFSGNGYIGGTGGLTKTGVEKLSMFTANTYTGKTSIQGGIFEINKFSTSGTSSPIGASTDTVPGNFILSNSYLKLLGAGSSNTTDRGITISGNDTIDVAESASAQHAFTGRIAGNGNIVKTGPGVMLLQPSNKNTFTGNVVIKNGVVSLGSTNANMYALGNLADTVILDGGKWSLYNNTSSTDYTSPWNIKVLSSGFITAPQRGTISGSVKGSGDLTIYIPATRTYLSGDWSGFTGKLTITTDADGGQLRFGKFNFAGMALSLPANVAVTCVNSNGATDYVYSVSIGEVSGAAGSSLTSDNWTIGAKNTDAVFNGTITGNSIIKTGTGAWTITGANTYTGGTTVNGGKLIVNNTTGSGTGTGSVTVNNSGTLGGTGSITGAVTIASGGMLAPGNNSIGSLFINNNITLADGSTCEIELNKELSKSDSVRVSGIMRFKGKLSVISLGNSTFASGDNFKIFKASVCAGSFSSLDPAMPGAGLLWDTTELRTKGILKVVKAIQSQTVNFEPLVQKTFRDAGFTLTASASSGLPVSFESSNTAVATISGNNVTITGAGTTVITASQNGNTDYSAASATQTLTVNRANQTITFNTLASKTYGDSPFDLSAGSSSGLPVTFTVPVSQVASVSGNKLTILGAGTVVVTASQPGNGNYNPALDATQTLTVAKANQTITFADITAKKVGDVPFELSATSTSGLPLTFISSNLNVATISGSTVTILSSGSTVITARQAGNENFNPAADQTKTLNVTSTGIQSTGFEKDILIAPNPVSDNLNITFPGTLNNVRIIICTVNGTKVFEKQVSDKVEIVPMSSFKAGIYLIKIIGPEGVVVKQIVKQ